RGPVERRVILAFILMLIVLVLPGILFPPKRADRRTVGRSDSTVTPRAPAESAAAPTGPSICPTVRRSDVPAETVWVSSPRARLTLAYVFFPDEYRFQVRGQVTGLGPAGAVLLVGMGDGLRSVEADTLDDFRHFAVVTKAAKTQSIAFQSLKPGTVKLLDGPFEWAGFKSKYFLTAALAVEENQPRFGGGIAVGGPVTVTTSSFFSGRAAVATRTTLALTLPVPPSGDFRYDVYTGPLE